jgi:uncharacterized membrane protein (DUF4010 family)
MHFLENISPDFINFILVTLMSLLIGLEQRHRHLDDEPETLYGTDRTYTFTGILGFVLYVISPKNLLPFLAGGFAIVVFLGIFYWRRILAQKRYGITSMIVLLITYCLAPLLYIKPLWLTILLVTIILIFIELKSQLRTLTSKLGSDEFMILAKFMIIAGIILPLLPNEIISPEIPISPYKIWLAVVVISGISYLSYLIQKFIFPAKGLVITGVLGGLYSSTATTVVLARKSKNIEATSLISSSIIVATGMMFIRILILTFIFNTKLGVKLTIPLISLTVITLLVAWVVNRTNRKTEEKVTQEFSNRNPLEFKTALLFAALFVTFALITRFVLHSFGVKGLNILSLVVGVTDITPFLLSMFTGKYDIVLTVMANATLIAITSNNLIKLGYALFLGSKKLAKPLVIGFGVIIAASVLFIVL